MNTADQPVPLYTRAVCNACGSHVEHKTIATVPKLQRACSSCGHVSDQPIEAPATDVAAQVDAAVERAREAARSRSLTGPVVAVAVERPNGKPSPCADGHAFEESRAPGGESCKRCGIAFAAALPPSRDATDIAPPHDAEYAPATALNAEPLAERVGCKHGHFACTQCADDEYKQRLLDRAEAAERRVQEIVAGCSGRDCATAKRFTLDSSCFVCAVAAANATCERAEAAERDLAACVENRRVTETTLLGQLATAREDLTIAESGRYRARTDALTLLELRGCDSLGPDSALIARVRSYATLDRQAREAGGKEESVSDNPWACESCGLNAAVFVGRKCKRCHDAARTMDDPPHEPRCPDSENCWTCCSGTYRNRKRAPDASEPAGEALTAGKVVARVTGCKTVTDSTGRESIAFSMSGDDAIALVERLVQQQREPLSIDIAHKNDALGNLRAQLATANAEVARLTAENEELNAVTRLCCKRQGAQPPADALRKAARNLIVVADNFDDELPDEMCDAVTALDRAVAAASPPAPAAEAGEVGRERVLVALSRLVLGMFAMPSLSREEREPEQSVLTAFLALDTSAVTREPRS